MPYSPDEVQHDMTATQAAESLAKNVWIKLIGATIVLALIPGALYGKNYLDNRFDTVDRRFASIEEKLATAAAKDKTDDGVANEFRTRVGILEETMRRGREDRERFQKDTQEALHEIRTTQLETLKSIAAILATTAETNRLQKPRQ